MAQFINIPVFQGNDFTRKPTYITINVDHITIIDILTYEGSVKGLPKQGSLIVLGETPVATPIDRNELIEALGGALTWVEKDQEPKPTKPTFIGIE